MRNKRIVIAAVVVGVVLTLTASIAYAASPSIEILKVKSLCGGKDILLRINVGWDATAGGAWVDVGFNDGEQMPGGGSGGTTGSEWREYRLTDSQQGKTITVDAWLTNGWFDRDAVAHDSATHVLCSDPEPDWYLGVEQYDTGTMKEASVPAEDGTLACGLFDVLSHGEKTVDLSLYPDCPAVVTVYCMNGAGEWWNSNVADLSISDDGVLQFTSTQTGLCGLFPAQ